MRAAIYTRVSSQRQVDEGHSLAGQRKNCEAFVNAKGWAVERVYEDAGVSGGKRSRPALNELTQGIEAGRVDVLVSAHLDRIGRSLLHSFELYEIFDAAGIALVTPDGTTYDGNSPAGELMRTVLMGAAQFERGMIKERTREGAEGKKARGVFNGGPVPFGYELGENGGLFVCEAEAKWIRHMFQRYAHDSASFYGIAKELAAKRVPTRRGGLWTGNAVAERIKQPMYAGYLKDGTKATHPPLVDMETFRRAQERIAATMTLNGNGRGNRSSAHLLSQGILRCECGKTMQANTDPNGRRYYRCRRKQAEVPGSCSMPNLPQGLVDEAILRYVSEHVISTGLTAGELEAEHTRAAKDATKAKADAERAIRQADEREASAELKWIDGKIDDQRWRDLQVRFDAEREQARTAAKTAEATLAALAEPDGEAIAAVERLRADLQAAATDELSLPRYHALIVKLFEHVEVLEADADAPEQSEDFPTTPTFIYRARQSTKGRERTHRYYLLPVLRPELALLYGGDPVNFVGTGDLIDRNAWA